MKKEIKLLNKRIERLNDEDFDLEAWKSGTLVVVGRIFGENSSFTREIQKLKFEFGSWSLRDASASRDRNESCKKQGREILMVAIEELEALGPKVIAQNNERALESAVSEILTIKEFNELQRLIEEEDKDSIQAFLNDINESKKGEMMVSLLLQVGKN